MDRAELDRRAEVLERLSAQGGPLTSEAPTATIHNPKFFGPSGNPTPARRQVQRQILQKYLEQYPNFEAEGQAIVMAGPPGAGKSSALQDIITETGISKEKWLLLDADEVKKLLLDQAQADGTYQDLIPDELRAEGITPYPAELASVVHEESSMLVKRLMNLALQGRWNVIIDGTLANLEKADKLLTELAKSGYTVHVVAVDVSLEDSKRRIRARWEEGVTDAAEGKNADGGRWVPPAFAESVFSPDDIHHSRCHSNAITLAKKHPHVLRLICRDGMTSRITGDYQRDKHGARLLEHGGRKARQMHLTDYPYPSAAHGELRGRHGPGAGD